MRPWTCFPRACIWWEAEPHVTPWNHGHRATLFPCPLHSLSGAYGDLIEALPGRIVSVMASLGNPVCPWSREPQKSPWKPREPGQLLSGIICVSVKGELGPEIRLCWVHNVLLSSCSIWGEEEITDFGLWAVVGQKPHLSLGFWPK